MKDDNMSGIKKTRHFIMTDQHVLLLSHLNVIMNETGEGTAPGGDTKRPYGNQDFIEDIVKILKSDCKRNDNGDFEDWVIKRASELHDETAIALKIILVTHSFLPGEYVADEYDDMSWRLI